MHTIKDVAKMAGCSASTVSRTLSGNIPVDEKTRQRVLECVATLNYQPNFLAKGLRGGSTRTIAFVIPNIENGIYPTLALTVEAEARALGYFVLFCNTQDDQRRELDYVQKLTRRFVDGFIFSTGVAGVISEASTMLRSEGTPHVCLMRAGADGADSFVVDNEQAAFDGVEFLIQQGFRTIATVTGRSSLLLYQQRLRGYQRALAVHGLEAHESLIWNAASGNAEQPYACVRSNLERGHIPQAIFAQSDPIAMAVIRAISDVGLRTPDDISVLGFDNMPSGEMLCPALTTVEQPLRDMGREATSKLIAMVEKRANSQPTPTIFPSRIIVRESVRLRSGHGQSL